MNLGNNWISRFLEYLRVILSSSTSRELPLIKYILSSHGTHDVPWYNLTDPSKFHRIKRKLRIFGIPFCTSLVQWWWCKKKKYNSLPDLLKLINFRVIFQKDELHRAHDTWFFLWAVVRENKSSWNDEKRRSYECEYQVCTNVGKLQFSILQGSKDHRSVS